MWQHRRLSIMKIMVLLWSTSVVKRIVALSLLSFSLIFLFGPFLFLWPLFYFFIFVRSLIPTCGGIIVSIILSSLWRCSNNDDHHTLFTYNSRITTRYLEQNMTLCECLRRCTGMCNESRVTCMKIMNGGFATNTMPTTWSCKAIWQWWCVS